MISVTEQQPWLWSILINQTLCVVAMLLQIRSALATAFSFGFNQHIGLKCQLGADGRLLLQEVRLCVGKEDFTPYNCR